MTAPSPTPSQTLAHLIETVAGSGIDSKRSSADAPSIIRTSPSGKRLTVHSHTGPISEPAPVRRSVLIAHPAVTDAISAPNTPMTFLNTDSDTSSDPADSSVKAPSPESEHDDAGSVLDFAGQVDPTQMFRISYAGCQFQGSAAAFLQLCNQLDGLKDKVQNMQMPSVVAQQPEPKPRPQTISSTALPYLPKIAPMSVDGESETQSGADSDADLRKNRLTALEALTGRPPAAKAPSPPPTARSNSHPDSLLPGKVAPIARKPLVHRPATTGGLYLAYPGARFNPFNEPLSSPLKPAATAAVEPRASSSAHFNRSSTPTSFADPVTHKQHYSRVESGIFDSDSDSATFSLPPRPGNPEPDARYSYFAPDTPSSGGAPVPPPSPPSPPSTAIRRKPVAAAVPNFSKPLPNLNKELPLSPGPADPKRFTNGNVPPQLSMNDSGFPVLNRNSASQFSIDPAYQRRSVNDAEAKFKRETAGKTGAQKKAKDQKKKAVKMADAIDRILLCGPQ